MVPNARQNLVCFDAQPVFASSAAGNARAVSPAFSFDATRRGKLPKTVGPTH